MIIDHSNMDSTDVAMQPCDVRPNAVDIMCVRCGWEGHVDVPHAPWPAFLDHIRNFPNDLDSPVPKHEGIVVNV